MVKLWTYLSLQIRHNLPDTVIFFIDNARVTKARQQIGQRQQVRGSKMRPSGRQDDKRIGQACIGPACRQRFERALFVVEEHPVLAPGLAHCQQLESAPEQRVERMSDFDKLPFTNIMGCS